VINGTSRTGPKHTGPLILDIKAFEGHQNTSTPTPLSNEGLQNTGSLRRQAQPMTRSNKLEKLSGFEDCNPVEIIAIVLQHFLTNQVQVLEKREGTDEIEKLQPRKLYAPYVEGLGLEVVGEA
jgi:hypothetical protein